MKTDGALLCHPNYRSNKQSKEFLEKMDYVKNNACPYAPI
jgi:hypothetical protein